MEASIQLPRHDHHGLELTPGQMVVNTLPPAGNNVTYQMSSTSKHKVSRGRYLTSNDPRGYIPVFEYPIGDQWIMLDAEDGYVLWTAIWKALGNAKADVVRMLDNMPELTPHVRRIRGGYLKIQGTWMKYEIARDFAQRVAYNIADDLVPLFGNTFPSTCLTPDQSGYGNILPGGRRRKNRQSVARKPTKTKAVEQPVPPPSHEEDGYPSDSYQTGPSGSYSDVPYSGQERGGNDNNNYEHKSRSSYDEKQSQSHPTTSSFIYHNGASMPHFTQSPMYQQQHFPSQAYYAAPVPPPMQQDVIAVGAYQSYYQPSTVLSDTGPVRSNHRQSHQQQRYRPYGPNNEQVHLNEGYEEDNNGVSGQRPPPVDYSRIHLPPLSDSQGARYPPIPPVSSNREGGSGGQQNSNHPQQQHEQQQYQRNGGGSVMHGMMDPSLVGSVPQLLMPGRDGGVNGLLSAAAAVEAAQNGGNNMPYTPSTRNSGGGGNSIEEHPKQPQSSVGLPISSARDDGGHET